MAILKRFDDAFVEHEVVVDDELLRCAKEIDASENSDCNMFPSADGKKIFLHMSYHREPGEMDTHSYKITVEKITYE